jgi:hypothetical protein
VGRNRLGDSFLKMTNAFLEGTHNIQQGTYKYGARLDETSPAPAENTA